MESGAKYVRQEAKVNGDEASSLHTFFQDLCCLGGRKQLSPVFLPFHSLVATDVVRGSSESMHARACM